MIAGLNAQLEAMQRKLWQEEMNGQCIMECRDFIQRHLGINAVRLPGLNINSPFFDDLIAGIVARLISETKRADKAEAAMAILPPPPSQQQTLSLFQVKQMLAQQALAQQAMAAQSGCNTNTIAVSGFGTGFTSSATTANTANAFYINNAATTSTLVSSGITYSAMVGNVMTDDDMVNLDNIVMSYGRAGRIKLPDRTEIVVEKDGSYSIIDKDAKVVYQANRVREFNRYINASDILAKFIEFCGKKAAVTREEMLELPVRLFIQYLILEAAKADGEPEPVDLTLIPDLRKVANCLGCDQPLPPERRARKLHYCGPGCLEQHEQRELAGIAA